MAIKTIHDNEVSRGELKVPYLAKHTQSDLVILVTDIVGSELHGVALVASERYDLGYKSTSWRTELFLPLPEGDELILKNQYGE